MKLYAHKKTVVYFDYNERLESVEGLAWSPDGNPANVFGFERGKFSELLADKRATAEESPGKIEILEGEPVERHTNLNPHGLI